MGGLVDEHQQQVLSPPLQQQSAFGTTPTFAPQPAYSSTPILNQAIEEDEPQVIKYVIVLHCARGCGY